MRWLLHLKAVRVAFTLSHSVHFFKAVFITKVTREGSKEKERTVQRGCILANADSPARGS